MPANCGICGEECVEDKCSIKCSGPCGRLFHVKCVKSDGIKTRTGNKDWKCDNCLAKRDIASVSSKSSGSTTALSKEFILSTMEEFKKEIFAELKNYASQVVGFHESIDFLSSKVDTSNKLMDDLRREYAEIRKENEKLRLENQSLNSAVNDLKGRVRMLEQYSRRTNIEINGVPITPKEDVLSLVKDIGATIGEVVQDTQVMAAHRVPTYRKDRTPPLVVQFQSRQQRDSWITSYKKKKTLLANEVNKVFPSHRMYINEHLTPENKLFLSQLKEKCKELSFKYVWVKEGKFFVRKTDGEKAFRINQLDDIPKLAK